jgi:hypothetical protein
MYDVFEVQTEMPKTENGKTENRKRHTTNKLLKLNNDELNNKELNNMCIGQSVSPQKEADGQTDETIKKIIKVADVYHYPESTAMFIENVITSLWTDGSMKTRLKMNLTYNQIKDRIRLCRINHIDTALSKMDTCKTNKELYFAKCLLTAIVEDNIEINKLEHAYS